MTTEKRRGTWWRKLIIIILVVAGISVMAYPYVSSFLNGIKQEQAIGGYLSDAANESMKEQDALLQEARDYNNNLLMSSAVMEEPFSLDAFLEALGDYDAILDISDTGMMGFIEIPSIDAELPIYHGTGTYALQHGVGHLETTSFPVGGKGSHAVLSAHSGLPQSKLFTDLDEVAIGDTFSITILNNKIWYEVYDIEVVLPEDVDSLVIDPERDLCTLLTCTPYGINTHRLLVHGERTVAPENEAPIEIVQDEPEENWSLTNVIINCASALALIIILCVVICKIRRDPRKEVTHDDSAEPKDEE